MQGLADRLITLQEFDQFLEQPQNRDRNFELIDGAIVEKMPTEIHATLQLIIGHFLLLYAWNLSNVRVLSEGRYRAVSSQIDDRIPDVSVRLTDAPALAMGPIPGMPDLAIEIKSPSDSYQHMIDAARYYLSNGSKMVWLVYPEKKLIEVLTATDRQLLSVEDTLSGGDLLPGFAVTVGDIFARI